MYGFFTNFQLFFLFVVKNVKFALNDRKINSGLGVNA